MEGVNGHFSWWKSRRANSATKISNFKFSFPNNNYGHINLDTQLKFCSSQKWDPSISNRLMRETNSIASPYLPKSLFNFLQFIKLIYVIVFFSFLKFVSS